MKKRILAMGILLVFAVLSLTGCGEKSILYFSNDWNIGYHEEAEYSVQYYSDYAVGKYSFSKNSALNDANLEIAYKDGSLKVRTEVMDKLSVTDENVLKSNILNEIPSSEGYVFCTTSEFNITACYKYGDMQDFQEYVDRVTEKVYFCQGKLGFAPIYSETLNLSSSLSYKSNVFSVERTYVKSSTLYDVSSYICKVEKIDTETNDVINYTEKTHKYYYKTLIDNAEFLFAVRFFNISDKSAVCPITSYNYLGTAKDIAYRSFQTATEENLAVKINGADTTLKLPVTCVSYEINESTSGKSQILFVQNGEDEGKLENKKLLVKYVMPLPVAHSFYYQGALVFTLSSLTFA